MPTEPTAPRDSDIDDIYRRLVRGAGREDVTESNVDALIRRAEQDGHTVLAAEMREWRASCGAPAPTAPPRISREGRG